MKVSDNTAPRDLLGSSWFEGPPQPPKHVFHTGEDRQGVRTLTHRRGALEFGSAVGEVVEGCLLAHWLQLERERKTVISSMVG